MMSLNWKTVLRDVAIIYALSFVGGFIVGVIGGATGGASSLMWLALSNTVMAIAGFAYSSSQTTQNRWPHLFAVAAGLWIVSFSNVLFGLASFSNVLIGVVPILVWMAVGGGIGALLKKQG